MSVNVVDDDRGKLVRLTETGVYYALTQAVDRSSCNGLVDYNNGCVLFNDRSSINYGALGSFAWLSGPSSSGSAQFEQDGGRNVDHLTISADQTY